METVVVKAGYVAKPKSLESVRVKIKERYTFYSVIKRFCDIGLSISLLLFSLPLWLFIALAIKLDSKGPVFFVQQRVGLNGRLFDIYKFRTMYQDVSKYQKAPTSRLDNRVTRVGRILRRFSLDELPQLLNVLEGSMSLVGPRPEMPFIVALYTPLQRRRLQVLPGVTGLWQICGRRDLPIVEDIKFDLYYVKKRSFLLDLSILIRTIPAVLFGRGAC